MKKSKLVKGINVAMALAATATAHAQDAAAPSAAVSSSGMDSQFYVNLFLLVVAFMLIPVIAILGKTLMLSIKNHQNKVIKSIALLLGLGLGINTMWAQDATATAAPASQTIPTWGQALPYILVTAILVEALIIFMMLFMINRVLKRDLPVSATAAQEAEAAKSKNSFSWQQIWDKINKFQPKEKEAELDTGHSYDGIRELNNITPPWFVFSFAGTIVFSVIYLWVYHVSESAPLQIQEYENSVAQAEIEKAAFLKTQANNVDENTVSMLDAAGIASGKVLFDKNCAACHKNDGGGGVGPNLTDDYSLHGNSISELFKTIKYGWTEKGMKAWKDDFSPVQIAQLASYVKSLEHSNVANGKPAQGDPIGEESTDTPAKSNADSLQVAL